MKVKLSLLFFLVLFLTKNLYSGGFYFPNVQFSYAKMYLYNLEDFERRPDYHIYGNGMYAQSKIGNGIDLPNDFMLKANKIFSKGIGEIYGGLSKCFIPRHGIIFYDNIGQPVASMSICLECSQISFWSVEPFEIEEPKKYNIKKAEQQIEEIKKLIAEVAPVYDNEYAYKSITTLNNEYKSVGSMTIKNNELDKVFGKLFLEEDIKNWALKKEYLKRDSVEKITNGGQSFFFKELKTNNHSEFLFSDVDEKSYLVQAIIKDNYFVLPNGVSIGMSSDDVIGTLGVYDGISNPEKIEMSGDKYRIIYLFKNQTLTQITLMVWPH